MDISKTRVDLVERAATILGKLVSGQNLEAEDSQTIDDLVDPLLLRLSEDGVIAIDDDEAIQLQYFLPLAKLLANEAAPSFSMPENPAIKQAEENLLRKLTAAKPTYDTLRPDYF